MFYMDWKRDTAPVMNKGHRDNLTTSSTNNDVQHNDIKSISTGDMEIKSKGFEETTEATVQEMINGSTVILVQQSNQLLTDKKKTQG